MVAPFPFSPEQLANTACATRASIRPRPESIRARLALPRSHPHISTGKKTNKFGIPIDAARELCRTMAFHEGIEVVGLHAHVGSQILDLQPLRRAAEALVALARELTDDGIHIEHVDVGGGLGISYDGQPAPTAGEYAAALLTSAQKVIDVAVLDTFKKNAGGDLGGENYVGTLANGGVGIAPFHDLDSVVPANVKTEVDQLKADIASGAVKVSDYLK